MKICPTCKSTYPTDFSVCPRDGTRLTEAGAWSEGTVIRGKYRILQKIGQGGMGAVYKAQHVRFEELRALKVMSAELADDPTFVKRFFNEAIITRKLQHPNAVHVEDVDEAEDGRPFIVMEYLDGFSLKHLMRESGPLPVARVCSIIRQAAGALQAAHALGMVHRDIKPDNLFLIAHPEGEQVKVLDFGIAKIKEASLGSAAAMTLTKTGVVVGTPQYMSPQQALGLRGDELDGRSDLYSLGVVMYEMLSGDPPFQADTTMKILMAHIHQPPPPIREAHPEIPIPDIVAALVMRLLEKKPEQRPSFAGELVREIDAALKAMATPLATTQVVSPRDLISSAAEEVSKHAGESGPRVIEAPASEPEISIKRDRATAPVQMAEPLRSHVEPDIPKLVQPRVAGVSKIPVTSTPQQPGPMDPVVVATLWGCGLSLLYWPIVVYLYEMEFAGGTFRYYFLRISFLGPVSITTLFLYAWTGALAGSLIGLLVRKLSSRLGAMAWGLGVALLFVPIFVAVISSNRLGPWVTGDERWRFFFSLTRLNVLPYGILGMVTAFLAQKFGAKSFQPALSGRARGIVTGILWGVGLSLVLWPVSVLFWADLPAGEFWSFIRYLNESLRLDACLLLNALVGVVAGGIIGWWGQKIHSRWRALAIGLGVSIVFLPAFIFPIAHFGFDFPLGAIGAVILRNLLWAPFLYGAMGAFIGFITRNRTGS